MNTLRGKRRSARETGRRRWFFPITLVVIAVAMVGIVQAPRSGLELADDAPGTLERSEAATTSAVSTTEVAPLPVETAAAASPDTMVAVAATPTPDAVGAVVLESYFAAIAAGDLVGAFGRLSPEHQAAVGGFGLFEAVWRAPAAVAHDPAQCAADQTAFECSITFRTYDAGGACRAAVYAYRLERSGTELAIVAERPVAERTCTSVAASTSATD